MNKSPRLTGVAVIGWSDVAHVGVHQWLRCRRYGTVRPRCPGGLDNGGKSSAATNNENTMVTVALV